MGRAFRAGRQVETHCNASVHALEDAGVIISYRPDIDKATVDRLKALTESYDKEVLMAPYQGLSNPIVETHCMRLY